MDPNETLRMLRDTESWSRVRENGWPVAYELFEALDEWLSKGGSLPGDWAQHFYRGTLARKTNED